MQVDGVDVDIARVKRLLTAFLRLFVGLHAPPIVRARLGSIAST